MCSALRELCFHDVANRGINPHHQFAIATQQRAIDQTAIIDCAQLVNQQIGIGFQPTLRRNAEAQRFRILHQLRG